MKLDRWQEILEHIQNTFEVEDSGKVEDEEQGGTTTEYIVFNSPMGYLRLEFSTHPAVLDTKTKYSHRVGGETNIEYVYSPTDKVHTLLIFKWDEARDDWIPFETEAFS